MKKLSLLVGGLILSTAVMAQKPDASVHNTLEGLINWNASTLSFTSPSIRYRYFVQDNIAVRVTLGVHNSSSTDNFTEFGDGTNSDGATFIDAYTESSEAKTSMFGVNLVAGTDYYFAENFYLGLELGLGWTSMTWKEGEATTTFGGTTTTSVTPEAKASDLNTGAVGSFRLGWRF